VPAPPPNAVPVTRCSSCRDVAHEAAAYVDHHPELVSRYGNVATDHVEQALFALQILGYPRPMDEVFESLWRRLWQAALFRRWADPATVYPGRVNGRPWDHVTISQRHELRVAFAEGLNERVLRHQPAVQVACPSRACLFCGIGSVSVPADQASRLGGPEAAAGSLWRRTVTSSTSLGRPGGETITGHLCPACARALQKAGAIGVTSRAQACADFLAIRDPGRARRLRDWLLDHQGANAAVPAWASEDRLPNDQPWSHIRAWLNTL
jgi:hypothetical protein